MVPDAKDGLSVPLLTAILERLAFVDGAASVTTIVYVSLVTPSWAVVPMVMALLPTTKGMLCDAFPDSTPAPLTVSVAVGSAVVGVIVMAGTP